MWEAYNLHADARSEKFGITLMLYAYLSFSNAEEPMSRLCYFGRTVSLEFSHFEVGRTAM